MGWPRQVIDIAPTKPMTKNNWLTLKATIFSIPKINSYMVCKIKTALLISHTQTHTYVSVGGTAEAVHQQLCRGACPQEYDKEEAGISSSRGMFSAARPVWLVRPVLLSLNCTAWRVYRKKEVSCYTACCENALHCSETERVSIIHNCALARTLSWNCHETSFCSFVLTLSCLGTVKSSHASF